MTHLPPVRALIAAGPEAPGTRALWARACARARLGSGASVFLTDDGLDWLGRTAALEAALRDGVDVALCSRSARERGLSAEGSPPQVRWSSLATWAGEVPENAHAWAAFP